MAELEVEAAWRAEFKRMSETQHGDTRGIESACTSFAGMHVVDHITFVRFL